MTGYVYRNDWSTVSVPELGRWRPSLTVSVVIPAYQCQASLDLTLAALARQTYPAELLEVVVVDDGSQPALTLPTLRPDRCRLVRPTRGWGRANALHHGVRESTGEVIHWLDADLLAFPSHVEAQARWHHQLTYAVTLGWKRFVPVSPGGAHWPSPDQVADAWAAGAADQLFAGLPSTGHDHVERRIAATNQLRDADHLGFLAHVGATAALRRELYEAAGGLDTALRLGEDTEFGYRLAQAGGVFVPVPRARSWHLGASHMMRHEAALQRYNQPFLANRMPQPGWLRRSASAAAVPLVTVETEFGQGSLEQVRAVVDALLASDEPDLRVRLVGSWSAVTGRRYAPLADPAGDLRLVAETYRSEPRVRLAEQPVATAFPSPYLLRLPAGCLLGRQAVRRLVAYADQRRHGLVRVPVRPGAAAVLWRTAAVHRARWVRRTGEPLAEAVARVHGAATLPPAAIGLADIATLTDADLARVVADPPRPSAAGPLPMVVEVAGVRSLLQATWLVARLAAVRAGLAASAAVRRGRHRIGAGRERG